MDEDSDVGCSISIVDHFTIERMRKDDPRLRQYLEIPEEAEQSSFDATIQLLPGSDELEVEDPILWIQFHLTLDDFNRLRLLGLKGRLRVTGSGTLGYAPYRARTLIVAQHQITEAVDLPQPDNCEVIYYQVGDDWRRFPTGVPVFEEKVPSEY